MHHKFTDFIRLPLSFASRSLAVVVVVLFGAEKEYFMWTNSPLFTALMHDAWCVSSEKKKYLNSRFSIQYVALTYRISQNKRDMWYQISCRSMRHKRHVARHESRSHLLSIYCQPIISLKFLPSKSYSDWCQMVMLGGIGISVKNSILIGRVTAVAASNRRRRPDFRPRSTVCVRDSAIKALLYIHNFSFPRFSLSLFLPSMSSYTSTAIFHALRVYTSSRTPLAFVSMHTRQPCSFKLVTLSSGNVCRILVHFSLCRLLIFVSHSLNIFFFLFSLRLTLSRSLRNNMHNKVQCYIHPWISYHGTERVWGEVKEVEREAQIEKRDENESIVAMRRGEKKAVEKGVKREKAWWGKV